MLCLRRLMNISYRDKITNIEVRSRVVKEIGKHSELLAMVIAKMLRWFGHVSRSNSISNTILQGSTERKEEEDGQGHNGKIISLNGLVLE